MTTRMTVQRLGRLVADGDAAAVRAAVEESPALVGAAAERAGQGGWTPLHEAVVAGDEEVVRVLADAGADLGARTDADRSPLHVALAAAPDLVPVLIGLGAPVDAPSAAYLDDADRLADVLDEDGTGSSELLAWAAAGGAARTARVLLDRGADPDGGALLAAAGAGSAELVELLLAAGADVDRREPDTGRTPLHAAVAAGPAGDTPEVVRLLLAAGADVSATTADGASALDILSVAAARTRPADDDEASGNDALADLLAAHGATS